MNYLVKTEPDVYSFDDLVRKGVDKWDGVRATAARLHLRAMKAGEEVFVYHTGDVRAVVGIARVVREAYPDPTDPEGKWSAVDLQPVARLVTPVPLSAYKAVDEFADLKLIREGRLSVMPIPANVWRWTLKQAGGAAPL